MRWTTLLALTVSLCEIQGSLAAENPQVDQPSIVKGFGQIFSCAGLPQFSVQAKEKSDAEAVCEGARRALAFLTRAGLESQQSTTIDVVPQLPGELATRAVGCYVRETKRVFLLSFAAFQAGGGWFRMPPSWELYRAAASHEIAHTVAGCNSEPRRLAVAAHEYVAYVVFFATMDPQLRASLLNKFPGKGFKSAGQISDINHILNPNQFGVDSWRHFLKVKNPERWLRLVISGEVVPDPVDDPDASSR